MRRLTLVMATCLLLLAPATLAQNNVELSILGWSHFVPRYEMWFDAWATNWGAANDVRVTVSHVSTPELAPALAAAIDAGGGHTIYEMVVSPSAFIEGLHPLNDINELAAAAHGERAATCKATSYLPRTDTWYAFSHGYVPDPGDYQYSIWADAGYPEGPSTWDELYEAGKAVYENSGVPLGLGMSPETDSRMAVRSIVWAWGGSLQDENENVVLDSPETIAAVKFLARLQNEVMTPEVFGWTAASNNQGLIAGELSYILNSISAYRSLQKIDAEAAADIRFVPALEGPAGAFASSHVWQIWVIPSYVQGDALEAAKRFILDHMENYSEATYHSELYNFPCFASTTPELDEWLSNDPFGSEPANKLEVLKSVNDWSVHVGYPGVSNPAAMQAYSENLMVNMVASVALGEKTAGEAVADAHARAEAIFAEWRTRGLVGGGEGQ